MNTTYDLRAARLRECPDVPGLPAQYRNDLRQIFNVWRAKLPRNIMRSRYYNGHEVVKNLGIAIPPDFAATVDSVVGWPQKAVDSLASVSSFDSFIGSNAAMGILDEVTEATDFYDKYDMMVPSELTHSCAAVTLSAGLDGLPQMNAHSAITAGLLWSYERNRVKCGCTVARIDEYGNVLAYNLYEDDAVVVIWRIDRTQTEWGFYVLPHAMGRPLIEPFVYGKSLDRPFGVSRINREVMSITDDAMRAALRMEIGAEFFTSPQKVLLGAPDGIFPQPEEEPKVDDEGEEVEDEEQVIRHKLDAQTAWEYYIGHVMAIGRDEDGNIPQLVQVSPTSMEPHIATLRALASRFAGATGVPLNELGIVQDNPSSAEAINASREPLIREANKLNTSNGRSLRTVGQMAVAIALNKPLSALTPEERDIRTHFMDPDRPSMVSRADALSKLAAAAPAFAKTRVFWEKAGLTDDQIDIVMTAQKQQDGAESFANLLAGVANGTRE